MVNNTQIEYVETGPNMEFTRKSMDIWHFLLLLWFRLFLAQHELWIYFFFSSFCLASMTFANKRTSEWSIFQRVRESMCCVVSNVYCYMQSSRETYEEINKRKRGDTRLRTTTNGMNVINRPRSHKLNDKNIITKNGQIQEIRWDNKRTTQREGERSTECLQDRTTQQQQQKQRQTPRATNRRTEIEDETEWGVKKKRH